jgi:hypothetical protein
MANVRGIAVEPPRDRRAADRHRAAAPAVAAAVDDALKR